MIALCASSDSASRTSTTVTSFHLGFPIRARERIAKNEAARFSSAADIPKAIAQRKKIHDSLKSFGFGYVALDLQGYRTGSLNEVLKTSEKSGG